MGPEGLNGPEMMREEVKRGVEEIKDQLSGIPESAYNDQIQYYREFLKSRGMDTSQMSPDEVLEKLVYVNLMKEIPE